MNDRLRLVIAETVAVLCAATALWPVFDSDGWILPVVLAVVVVTAGAELLRRVGLPRYLVPFGSLAVLLVWLIATRARDVAPLGLLPSPASMDRLVDVLRAGFDDVQNDAAPVPTTPGLLLLAVGGLGLTAVVVDFVTVTLRRPALAGLPLLVVYAVPGSVAPSGVPWLAFVLGAAGYLALLLAESRDRVGRWGRLLGGSRSRVVNNPLSIVGRRVGGTALAVAVLVPAIVPGLDGQVLRIGDGGDGSGTGTGRIGSGGDPLVNLSRDLGEREEIDVLTMEVPLPPGGPQAVNADIAPYLRTTVFTSFDGTKWLHSRNTPDASSQDGTLTPSWGGLAVNEPRAVTIDTTKQARVRYLPTPYGATRVTGLEGDWAQDNGAQEIFGVGRQNAADMTYTVRQAEPRPDEQELLKVENGPSTPALLETGGLENRPRVEAAIADAVGAEDRPFAQAIKIQAWLRDTDRFTYDTTAPETTDQASLLENFLEQKRGFCVHYASAMVIMARAKGIPARLAVGYLPGNGESDGPNTKYRITTLLSHAWPELYFEGAGWLRFEPTPRSDDAVAQRPSYAEFETPEEVTATVAPTAAPTTSTGATPSASSASADPNDRESIDDAAVAAANAGSGGSSTPWLTLGGVLLAVGLALAPAAMRRRLRSRRLRAGGTPAGVAAAWEEMCDVAIDLGLGGRVGAQTPRQYAASLARTSGMTVEGDSPLARLLQTYERARFAGAGSALPEVGADAGQISAALMAGSTSTDRFRARWVPRSTWGNLRTGLGDLVRRASGAMSGLSSRISLRALRPRRG